MPKKREYRNGSQEINSMAIHDRLKAESDAAEAELTALNTADEVQPTEPTQDVEQSGQDTETVAAEEAAQEKDIDWKAESEREQQRYRVMQGKYNAEIPRLQEQIRELQESAKNTQAEEPALDEDDDFPELTERVQPLEERLRSIEQKEEQAQSEQAAQQMLAELETLTPDWKQINETPEFLEWLGETDPFTGVQRQTAISEAESNRDASRLSGIMNAWKATQQRKPQQSSLEKRVTPSNKAGSEQPQGKPTYTQADVNKHFESVRRAKSTGHFTEERARQAQQFERELFAAEAEGRIAY